MTGSQPSVRHPTPHGASGVPVALHAARNRFVGLILPRLMAFETLRAALALSPDSRAELVEIGALCHKIAGVAETLGFERAGDMAGRLDGAIDQGLASGAAPRDVWQRIDPALEMLMDELEDAIEP